METVAGRPVVYGLGNFVWNTPGRFEPKEAPPFGLAAAVKLRCQESRTALSLRLYPLLIDNSVTEFQTRPVSGAEAPEAFAALTRNFDQPLDMLVQGSDNLGFYVELDLDALARATRPADLPATPAPGGPDPLALTG
jgi:cyanophycin synthetase